MLDAFQALEQLAAMLRDLAPVMYSYRKDLMAAGFSREESFIMAVEMQKSIMRGASNHKE